jgi:hypothetical protein
MQVLWIPEFFKARGVHSASLYAETFAVAAANLPGTLHVGGAGLVVCVCVCVVVCVWMCVCVGVWVGGYNQHNTHHIDSCLCAFSGMLQCV